MELDTSGRAGRAGLGRQMPAVLGELVGQAAQEPHAHSGDAVCRHFWNSGQTEDLLLEREHLSTRNVHRGLKKGRDVLDVRTEK